MLLGRYDHKPGRVVCETGWWKLTETIDGRNVNHNVHLISPVVYIYQIVERTVHAKTQLAKLINKEPFWYKC